jgi:predicted TIM-barrel fold metal-dependent hydrolase
LKQSLVDLPPDRKVNERPPFFEIIAAGDRMLAKHPRLRVVACHYGSLYFDLNVLADLFDAFPNLAAENCALPRSRLLHGQDRSKIRDFYIKYQDRILFGSDIAGGLVATDYMVDRAKLADRWTPRELQRKEIALRERYDEAVRFFATDQIVVVGRYAAPGLALPPEVLRKVFFDNAVRWVPGIATQNSNEG